MFQSSVLWDDELLCNLMEESLETYDKQDNWQTYKC